MKIIRVGDTRRLLWGCCCVVLALTLGRGMATPVVLIQDSFESYTVGQSINGLNPNDGNPNDWYTASLGAPTNQITPAASTGGSGANEKVLTLHAWDGSTQSVRFGRNFEEDITQSSATPLVTMTWKHRYDGTSNDQFIGIHANDSGSGAATGWLGAIRLASDGVRYDRRSFGGSTDYSGTVFTFNTTDWYEITITADVNTRQWSFSILNLDDPNNSYSLAERDFITDNYHARGIYSVNRSGSYGTSGFSMDDVLVTAMIPEPGSLWLFLSAIGGLLLLRRRGG